MSKVFYSWQSDLPNSTNRGLIEAALQKALKQLEGDSSIVEPIREIDKDTRGVPGSPDIVKTILAKIDAAAACVFDVSIVLRSNDRASPNPNVLLELGYALRAHPFERIILVFNSAFGDLRELPFDLRGRRAIQYESRENDSDRAKPREQLSNELMTALRLVDEYNRNNRFNAEEIKFYQALYANLREVLDLAAEYDYRLMNPHASELRRRCATIAGSLRELAVTDTAIGMNSLSAELRGLAEMIEPFANAHITIGSGSRDRGMVKSIAKSASEVMQFCIEPLSQQLSMQDYAGEKRTLARRAVDGLDRLRTAVTQLDSRSIKGVRDALAICGKAMLKLAGELEIVADLDAQVFRSAGHALHVADIERSHVVGFAQATQLSAELEPLVSPLARFASSSPPQSSL